MHFNFLTFNCNDRKEDEEGTDDCWRNIFLVNFALIKWKGREEMICFLYVEVNYKSSVRLQI